MRQGPNSRRARGRSSNASRRTNLPNRNQTFDSNGPEVRIRGNAYQVHEKYLTLARDASAAGDRVMSENYLQHAEHYYRIINSMNEAYAQAERQPYDNQQPSGREGKQRDYGHRDNGRGDGEPRDGQSREVEFGEDPRGLEDNEPMSLDRPTGESDAAESASAEGDGDGDGGAGSGGDSPKPARQRRRPPRPRRPAGGNGSAEASEGPTEGGGD